MEQHFKPDEYFTREQLDRLQELMERLRMVHETNTQLSECDRSELEGLIDQELVAAAARAESVAGKQSP